jgi:hypothetical protein
LRDKLVDVLINFGIKEQNENLERLKKEKARGKGRKDLKKELEDMLEKVEDGTLAESVFKDGF